MSRDIDLLAGRVGIEVPEKKKDFLLSTSSRKI
jgi:hypothetical protein